MSSANDAIRPRGAAARLRRTALAGSTLSVGGGVVLLAVIAAMILLQALVLEPRLVPVVLLAAVLIPFLVARPRWVVPAFVALTWTAIGGQYFGGLPSPIETGGMALLAVALWFGLREPDRAQDTLLVIALIWLPLTATSLLHLQSMAVPLDALEDFAFLPIAALCLRSVQDVERAVVALVAVGAFLGAGAAWSILVGPTTLFPLEEAVDIYHNVVDSPRAVGPFGESNFFAMSLAVLAPLALYLVSRGGWHAALGGATIPCLAAGIFSASSRGALLAMVFGILAYAFTSGDRRLRLVAVAAIAIGAALIPVFSAQTGSAQSRSVEGRATENLIAVAMFADHPLTGVGPRRYPVLYSDYTRELGSDSRAQREPHSLPLQIAAEQGIAGIVGWLAALLFVGRYVISRGVWRIPVGRALILTIATYGVNSLFLHGSQLRLLFILAGMLLALGAVSKVTSRAERHAA